MACIEDGEVIGFDEAISWLPSHVLDEAIWDTKENMKRQNHHNFPKYLPLDPHPQRSKSNPRTYCKTKYGNNWTSGGAGMRAVFLDSGKKSPGTGVFLPQRADANLQPSKRPACSPVLLPARVVQALNLNVHEIGLHISRRQDNKNDKSEGGECNSFNKNGKDLSVQCGIVSHNENSSPEIFLPKEWTY